MSIRCSFFAQPRKQRKCGRSSEVALRGIRFIVDTALGESVFTVRILAGIRAIYQESLDFSCELLSLSTSPAARYLDGLSGQPSLFVTCRLGCLRLRRVSSPLAHAYRTAESSQLLRPFSAQPLPKGPLWWVPSSQPSPPPINEKINPLAPPTAFAVARRVVLSTQE